MGKETIGFASDLDGRDGDIASPDAPTSTSPSPASAAGSPAVGPTALRKAGVAFADLMMWIGVFITGGIFGLLGYRRISVLRLCVEAAIVAGLAAAWYFAAGTWLPSADALDLGDPLHRALAFTAGAVALAYIGGIVVHLGWHRKGDPKISMLVMAVGMTLIGLRIASLGMAYGQIKVADARIDAGSAGLAAIKSAVDVMKAEGVDPKPMAKVIIDFQKDIYGSKYIEGFYAMIGKPKETVEMPELEGAVAAPARKEVEDVPAVAVQADPSGALETYSLGSGEPLR